MKKFLFNKDIIKNWQLLIFLLCLNEIMLIGVQEALEPGFVIGGFVHMPEKSYDLETFKHHVKIVYRYALILLPFIMTLKYFLLSLFLQMAFTIQFKDLPFIKSFRIIMIASFSQIFAGLARYAIFIKSNLEPGSGRIQEIIPLGAVSFFDISTLNTPTFFLLNQFNLFEVLWCLLIYHGLVYFRIDTRENLRRLVPIIWLTFVFLQFLSVLVSYQLIEI
jgi:hypothetical protein